MDRQNQNMYVGHALHQPTSNGKEIITCRNKNLIRDDNGEFGKE